MTSLSAKCSLFPPLPDRSPQYAGCDRLHQSEQIGLQADRGLPGRIRRPRPGDRRGIVPGAGRTRNRTRREIATAHGLTGGAR